MRSRSCHQQHPGAVVASVTKGSPAESAGIRGGDLIIAANGKPIEDFLDFYLASFETSLWLKIKRDSSEITSQVKRERGEDLGIIIDPGKPLICNNRCIFCFVDQLPKGLRHDLYVKDEDYRLSFLHGNYITMTNLTDDDIQRIVDSNLSPLFVSVHATDEQCRSRLLGRSHKTNLLRTIDRLGEAGIKFHCQIVLVPGYNDGSVLTMTIQDLVDRSDFILSVSVVPVGLTKHRNHLPKIKAVTPGLANLVLDMIDQIQNRVRPMLGRGLIYASDEIFEIASRPIPSCQYYDDYPQFENGVGMIRTFLDSLVPLKVPKTLRGLNLLMITAPLAFNYIKRFCQILNRAGVNADLVCIPNRLLGETITVSGLLPGNAIIQALTDLRKIDVLLLPPNVVNQAGLFIDDISLETMKELFKTKIVIGSYSANETIDSVRWALGV